MMSMQVRETSLEQTTRRVAFREFWAALRTLPAPEKQAGGRQAVTPQGAAVEVIGCRSGQFVATVD
jgi:hypothetical protein